MKPTAGDKRESDRSSFEIAARHAQQLGASWAATDRRLLNAVLEGASTWVSDVQRERAMLGFCAAAVLKQKAIYVSPSLNALTALQRRLESVGLRAQLCENASTDSALPRANAVLLCRPEALERADLLRAAARAELTALAIDDAELLAPSTAELSPAYERLPALLAPYAKVPLFALSRPIPIAQRRAALDRLGRHELADLSLPLLENDVIIDTVTARSDRQKPALIELLNDLPGAGVVLCATPHEVDAVAAVIGGAAGQVARLHNAMPEAAQRQALEAFQRADRAVLVTSAELPGAGLVGVAEAVSSSAASALTSAPWRSDLRFCVRFHAPASPEQWLRELAWLGRDGQGGQGIVFYDSARRSLNEAMLDQHRLRGAQLELVGRLLSTATNARAASVEWLALQSGLSRRTTDRLLAILTDFGALERSGAQVSRIDLDALDAGVAGLGQRLEAMRRADSERLSALERIAQTQHCRRRQLGHYFGVESPTCGQCSACLPRHAESRTPSHLATPRNGA